MNTIDRFFSPDAATFADSYLEHVTDVLGRIDRREIARFIQVLLDARERGATVFFIGNGGSAATASHFANDLTIGTGDYARPFRVMSLTDNVSVLTAISNDFGYEEVFVRKLKILGKAGDVVVAISASGNSPNLLTAFAYAEECGMTRVALTSFDGGKLRPLAEVCVHVPTEPKEYGPAEDAHMVLDHLVGAYLARYLRHAANV
jgi:D-sedoheptulose 7-phosphate isomerase